MNTSSGQKSDQVLQENCMYTVRIRIILTTMIQNKIITKKVEKNKKGIDK